MLKRDYHWLLKANNSLIPLECSSKHGKTRQKRRKKHEEPFSKLNISLLIGVYLVSCIYMKKYDIAVNVKQSNINQCDRFFFAYMYVISIYF